MNIGKNIKLISHRGNINALNPHRENTLDYIQEALDLGYDVEIDLWYENNKLLLGHDYGEHPVSIKWLLERKYNLWIHCKHFNSLEYLHKLNGFQYFFHKEEEYTLISTGHIWAHNLSQINNKCVIPLLSKQDLLKWGSKDVYGICSDFIGLVK